MIQQLSNRRRVWCAVMKGLCYISIALVTVLTAFMLIYVLFRGLPEITWDLLSTSPSYLRHTIGILPDIMNTIYVVVATLVMVLPIGVGAAIYLNEYAKNRKVVELIEFAAETLSGIPSIIYGLVGMLVFCQFFGLQTSLMAGSMTLVIMNLPTILRTTQGPAQLHQRHCDRLYPGCRKNSRRECRPTVHHRLCPQPQRFLRRAWQQRCHTDSRPLCLCQGAG